MRLSTWQYFPRFLLNLSVTTLVDWIVDAYHVECATGQRHEFYGCPGATYARPSATTILTSDDIVRNTSRNQFWTMFEIGRSATRCFIGYREVLSYQSLNVPYVSTAPALVHPSGQTRRCGTLPYGRTAHARRYTPHYQIVTDRAAIFVNRRLGTKYVNTDCGVSWNWHVTWFGQICKLAFSVFYEWNRCGRTNTTSIGQRWSNSIHAVVAVLAHLAFMVCFRSLGLMH